VTLDKSVPIGLPFGLTRPSDMVIQTIIATM